MEEHLKQLRATHFALVLLAFALFAMSLERVPNEAEEALKQAKAIHSIVLSWDPRFLDTYARKLLKEQGVSESFKLSGALNFAHQGTKQSLSLEFSEPSWTLHPLPSTIAELDKSYKDDLVSYFDHLQLRNEYLHGRTFLGSPQTLDEFASLWNALGNALEVRKPVDVARQGFIHSVFDSSGEWITASAAPEAWPTRRLRMLFRALTPYEKEYFSKSQEFQRRPYSHFFTGGFILNSPREQWELELPVLTTNVVSFNGQAALLSGRPGVNWTLGSFADTFPELDRESAGFRDVATGTAIAILDALARRPSERFEAFGVKIPTVKALILGIPVILAIQIYLLIILGVLGGYLGSASSLSRLEWVGFYKSWPARWLTELTAFVIPSVVVLILLVQEATARDNPWVWVLGVIVICFSAWVALMSDRTLKALLGELAEQGSGQSSGATENAKPEPQKGG